MSNSRKLATASDYMRKVFIAPDEPVGVRRKKTLEYLRNKALKAQQVVAVINDTSYLYVDGELVSDGFVRKRGSIQSNNGGQ